MKKILPIGFAICMMVACKPGSDLDGEGSVSGLYAVGVQEGQALTGAEASGEMAQYCGAGQIDQYIASVAGKISFNAGYKEHPNAGYDAQIVKKVGNDGKEGYYFGQGSMFSGAGNLAMMPGKGRVDEIIRGTCRVILNSIGGAGGTTKGANCKYPQATVSRGGSVSGTSANGSVNGTGCTTIKMSNDSIKHKYEVAFCPQAVAGFFDTTGSGAAGEMHFIIKGN